MFYKVLKLISWTFFLFLNAYGMENIDTLFVPFYEKNKDFIIFLQEEDIIEFDALIIEKYGETTFNNFIKSNILHACKTQLIFAFYCTMLINQPNSWGIYYDHTCGNNEPQSPINALTECFELLFIAENTSSLKLQKFIALSILFTINMILDSIWVLPTKEYSTNQNYANWAMKNTAETELLTVLWQDFKDCSYLSTINRNILEKKINNPIFFARYKKNTLNPFYGFKNEQLLTKKNLVQLLQLNNKYLTQLIPILAPSCTLPSIDNQIDYLTITRFNSFDEQEAALKCPWYKITESMDLLYATIRNNYKKTIKALTLIHYLTNEKKYTNFHKRHEKKRDRMFFVQSFIHIATYLAIF